MATESKGKVLLRVRPRGFCAGVVRAVDIVELALEAYGNPVYVHHEIVHNTYVVEQLRRRGAIFVESIDEVPQGAVLVFSAHGVPPGVRDEAKARSSFLTQTTLSLYDTQEIVARLRQKFPKIVGPKSDDICYATQNRQEAVEQVAQDVDLILVVGSQNSSNSNRLVEVAQRRGVKAELIDSASDINPAWLEGVRSVGLTAGASAPEVLVEQVSQRLAEHGYTDQRDLDLIREDVRFTLPPELATIAAAPRR